MAEQVREPEQAIYELLARSGGVEESEGFVRVTTEEEFKAFLHFLESTTPNNQLVVAGYTHPPTEADGKEITLSKAGGKPSFESRSLEESWVYVEPSNEAKAWVRSQDYVNTVPGFFDKWPSFGVVDKMTSVAQVSGAYFLFGYTIATKSVIESLTRLAETNPGLVFGTCAASSYAMYLFPQLFFKAASYIALGTLAAGSVAAAPILVVGTSGIFIAATTYHSFQAFRRLGSLAIKGGTKMLK